MQQYQNVIQDKFGNVIVGASVAVYVYGTTTPATIYSGNGTGLLPSNTVTTSSLGEFAFYAANGRYSLTVTATNFVAENYSDFILYDPADIGAVAASGVSFTPSGTISATNVQNAIQEVVSDLAGSTGSSLVGFVQLGTGAQARTVQTKVREEEVSVKDFGAVGDGTTDDTAAIQAAINYCFGSAASPNGSANAKLNRRLFIPCGNYKLTDELVITKLSGGQIYGEGRFATILNQTTANKPIFRTNGCSYSVFADMHLRNQSVANNTAIFELSWDGSSGGAALQSNTFRNMYFSASTSLVVNAGLRIAIGGYMGSENLIENCFFEGCFKGLTTASFNALQNIVLGGNFQACTYGVFTSSGSVTNIIGTGFQNDVATTPQVNGSGYDIYFQNSANDTSVVEGCRSESMRFLFAGNQFNANLVSNTVIPSRPVPWTANTVKALDAFVDGDGLAYDCTTAGTTGSTEPTWGGTTVTDGTVTWTRLDFSIVGTNEGYIGGNVLPYGQLTNIRSQVIIERNVFTRGDFIGGTPYQSETDSPILINNIVRYPTQGGTITAPFQSGSGSWAPKYVALDAGRTAAILFNGYNGRAVGFQRGKINASLTSQNSIGVEGVLSGRAVSGTDEAGLPLYLGGGPGTGAGAGGSIVFRVAPAGAAGTTVNDFTDAATLTVNRTFSAVNGLVMRTATAAAIADAANAVNGTGKVVGLAVWDTTNNRLMVASGSATTSAWYVADGSASVTPV